MGVHEVREAGKGASAASFRQSLLTDLRALEQMLEEDLLERDVVRVGVEQEMFLLDRAFHPAPVASQVLSRLADPTFTTEIGKFNLEANMRPRAFERDCLRSIESELESIVQRAAVAAQEHGADVLLAGILPSVRLADLSLQNLTDKPRYHELNRAVMDLRGGSYHLLIKGVDELQLTHDNVMPEACCTSFQVHMQMDPHSFATDYNASLLAAAPILAVAVNSPMLLGKRLWLETRIALFQHAVDERSQSHIARSHPTRVSFGEAWIERSVLEIYREQVARFRVIMTSAVEENSLEVLAGGGIPALKALVLHNGTVWRWNRPCYGVTDGRPHLRLEFRALPAGPTVLDEVANAAFFLGLMRSLPKEYGDVSTKMPFEDAKDNFFAAARHGLKAQLTWIDDKHYSVQDLVKQRLLPLAAEGLRDANIDAADVDRYLGVIDERIEAGQTGSKWMLSAAAALSVHASREFRDQRLVAAMLVREKSGQPAHQWERISKLELEAFSSLPETVGEIMSTDLFTVSPDDPITLAASLMDWRHIRQLPVEQDGQLAGLISSREIFHFIAIPDRPHENPKLVTVGELMNSEPVTVTRETSIGEALNLARDHHADCLPVTDGNRLIGIVTSQNFLQVLSALLRKEQTSIPEAASAGAG